MKHFLKKVKNIVEKLLDSNISILLSICLIVLFCFVIKSINSKFQISFLDVGQGDSILIRSPGYRYVLIDSGEGEEVVEQLSEVLPFWKRKIDIVVATHNHDDHIGGFEHIFAKYEVDKFLASPKSQATALSESIYLQAEEKQIEKLEVSKGGNILVGNISLEILAPSLDESGSENENNNSIVMKGNFNDSLTFLLTGDGEVELENSLVDSKFDLRSNIIKVGHHGSKTSSSKEFLFSVDPSFAIISCGEGNKFNHPDKEVVDRYLDADIDLYRTDLNGRVEFYIEKGKIYKKVEKNFY